MLLVEKRIPTINDGKHSRYWREQLVITFDRIADSSGPGKADEVVAMAQIPFTTERIPVS